MKRSVTILLLVCVVNLVHGQEYIYGLYKYATWSYNPSSVAIDNQASISYLHQESQVGPGVNFAHNLLSAEYPIVSKTGNRYGGLGLTFLEKDAGDTDLLKTYSVGLSLAYSMQIADNQNIAYGIRGNYFNKRTALENLSTGSQWIAEEFRYDPNQALGENIIENNISYIGLDAGATWNLLNDDGSEKAFVGFSVFHLNKPDDSFIEGQSQLPMSYFLNAGARVFQNKRLSVTPLLFYQIESGIHTVNGIVSTKIFIHNENPYDIIKNGNLELLTKYDFSKTASIGLIFNQPNVSFGFSYNFPISNQVDSRYLNGGSEFGITLSKTVFKAKPQKVVIDESTPGRARDFYFDRQDDKPQLSTTKSDVEIIEENIEQMAGVKSLQFNLDKDFKFEFGKAELNESSKSYLDDIYQMLQDNPKMNLKVVGHTDNVGSNQANFKLSMERAQVVADYLLNEKNLEPSRIETSGKGDTEPITDNDSEESRSKNRRVEFIIYLNR